MEQPRGLASGDLLLNPRNYCIIGPPRIEELSSMGYQDKKEDRSKKKIMLENGFSKAGVWIKMTRKILNVVVYMSVCLRCLDSLCTKLWKRTCFLRIFTPKVIFPIYLFYPGILDEF